MSRSITEVFNDVRQKRMSMHRWLQFKDARLPWANKTAIQAMVKRMCDWIEHLESENKRLVEKNNDILTKKAEEIAKEYGIELPPKPEAPATMEAQSSNESDTKQENLQSKEA